MGYHNARITLEDNMMDMIMKVTEGNPGAVSVCMKLIEKSAVIDPDAALGPLTNLFALDTHDIYGSRIWQLYKDVCKTDLVSMIGLLRAVQLGFLTESELHSAIDGAKKPDDWIIGHVAKVKERLPAFGITAA